MAFFHRHFGVAFESNQIASLIIPNGVTQMGTTTIAVGPFYENPITTLVIPSSLAGEYGIVRGAFSYLSITRVTLPANMNEVVMQTNFEESLVNFWRSQNRAAGTYIKNGPIWSRQ